MSILNNMSEFVNDPSLHIMNYIFPVKKQKSPGLAQVSSNLVEESLDRRSELQTAMSGNNKVVQAGGGLKKYRKASVQCYLLTNKESRSTTFDKNSLEIKVDRRVGKDYITLKENGTTPSQQIVCDQHREAFAKLISWPYEQQHQPTYAIDTLISAVLGIIHIFDAQKIDVTPKPNVTPQAFLMYRSPSAEFLKIRPILKSPEALKPVQTKRGKNFLKRNSKKKSKKDKAKIPETLNKKSRNKKHNCEML